MSRPVPAQNPHTFQDVLIITQRDGGWVCEINRTPVWIGELQIEPGTMVPTQGTRGPLTIAAFAVEKVLQQLRPRFL